MGEIGDDCRYNIEDTINTTLLVDSPNWIYASYTSQVYYFLYVFIVVITLSTVLIAVVTDSFAYIKKERSAMVFWSNRCVRNRVLSYVCLCQPSFCCLILPF